MRKFLERFREDLPLDLSNRVASSTSLGTPTGADFKGEIQRIASLSIDWIISVHLAILITPRDIQRPLKAYRSSANAIPDDIPRQGQSSHQMQMVPQVPESVPGSSHAMLLAQPGNPWLNEIFTESLDTGSDRMPETTPGSSHAMLLAQPEKYWLNENFTEHLDPGSEEVPGLNPPFQNEIPYEHMGCDLNVLIPYSAVRP